MRTREPRRRKNPLRTLLLLALLSIPPLSCGLAQLPDPGGTRCFPSADGAVLEAGETVGVSFDFPVHRRSAEELLSVRDYRGPLEGRLSWDGGSLRFAPEPDYVPGRRYIFSFSGTFRDEKGSMREHRHCVSFHYAAVREKGAGLVSASPPPGSILSGDGEILLEFSSPMDPVSFLTGLSVEPKTPFASRWDGEGRSLRISPEKGWKNLSSLTLVFGDELADREGFPSAPRGPLLYFVQGDTEPPRLISVEAALNDPEALFPPVGGDLSHCLAFRDALRLTFSEAMKPQETRDAVSLAPEPPGSWHWLDRRTLIFRPQTGYRAGQTYTLTLGPQAEDLAGNRLAPVAPLSFVPRIELLTATLELAGDGLFLSDGEFSASEPRLISPPPPRWTDYTFIIRFHGGRFETREEKLAAQRGIVLRRLFPPSTPDPHPVGWSWPSPDRVSVTFSGFRPSPAAGGNHYLLHLRGGPEGISTGDGNMFPRSREQLLMTREEE